MMKHCIRDARKQVWTMYMNKQKLKYRPRRQDSLCWCKRENVEPDALKEWKINIFKIIDTRISFYSRNTHLLSHKPKSSFCHLKRGIQDFYMNCVLVPADKAANNVVVVWRLYHINTLKRELVDTNAYKQQPSFSERVIVDGHGCHTALPFGVKAKEIQDKVPTLYWLPKLHKNHLKQDLLLILVLVRQQNFLNC